MTPRWILVLAAIALLKVILAGVSLLYLAIAAVPLPGSQLLRMFIALVFSGCGAFLVWSGRADARPP